MFAAKNELFTRPSGYTISRSVRLRSSASAYFNRTPASSTNQTTFTWSAWVKRGALGSGVTGTLFYAGGSSSYWFQIRFNADSLSVVATNSGAATIIDVSTPAVFRDPSAWYHVVMKIDTTQATAANRVIVYVNGVQQTLTITTQISQNQVTSVNTNVIHTLGQLNYATTNYFDGYLTEVNFIDGQALTPSSFGQTNSVTGVWQPIKYTGTYGTNGFYLNFSDNSAATAAAIGKDYSGNGNNWTPNNISVTSGVTYDSMIDSPTVSAASSNYCVWNPALPSQMAGGSASITNGNLTASDASTSYGVAAQGSFGVTSGKWYWEVTASTVGGNYGACGVRLTTVQGTSDGAGYFYFSDGQKVTTVFGGGATSYGNSYTSGDVIGVALDMDNGKIWFSKNGTWQASGDPAAGTNAAYTGLSGSFSACVGDGQNSTAYVWNATFGQRPFSYTPPSGFKALNTFNLPTPTIVNGATVMAASLYTGTGSSQTISNAVNNVSFQPDWVWIKSRSGATNNELTDSVRGATKSLVSNSTAAEATDTNGLTAFGSTGFTVGSDTNYNNNTATYVAWQWKAGGTSSSNTNGSITSTVSVNATAGFSIATYTGTGANATVGHGLGVAPSMIIIKCRDSATDPSWIVGHTGIVMGTGRLILNGTDANSNAGASSLWNSTAANSSVFSLGTYSSVNQNTLRFVAYLFAEVAGFSKFGSYTGNGSSDGPFVYCGFRPRYVFVKRIDTTADWYTFDTSRNSYNALDAELDLNIAIAETTAGGATFDFLSNGFKLRRTGNAVNNSGGTYIYAAFAENPFKYSLAR